MKKYLLSIFLILLFLPMGFAQNDSSDNETTIIYGPNVVNNTEISFSTTIILLIFFIIFGIIAFAARNFIGYLLAGFYTLVYAIYLISQIGFWLGMLAVGIAVLFFGLAYNKFNK